MRAGSIAGRSNPRVARQVKSAIGQRYLSVGLALAVVLSTFGLVAPAQAAYPGPAENGRIAFVSHDHGLMEIYTAAPDGSGRVRLTDNTIADTSPMYSPDGGTIVFTRKTNGTNNDIYIMSADGTNVVRLTDSPASDFDPIFSPDGTRIAFVTTRLGGDEDIFTMSLDGANETPVRDTTTQERLEAWSPDGNWMLFSRRVGNYHDVYRIAADGSGSELLVTPNTGTSNEMDADFDPSGTKITYSRSGSATNGIYTANADGSAPRLIVAGGHRYPDFSPEGGQLVYSHRIEPSSTLDYDVRTLDLTTGATDTVYSVVGSVQTLPEWGTVTGSGATPTPTPTPTHTSTPHVDPEPGIIAFHRGVGDGRWDIFLTDLAGNVAQLTTTGMAYRPSFSPDGSQIAYEQAGRLWVMDADGANKRKVSETVAGTPAWSPDGTKLAYPSPRNGGQHIFYSDLDGGNEVQVTNFSGAYAMQPAWAPDMKSMSFTYTVPGGRSDIYRADLTSEGFPITNLTRTDMQSEAHSFWAPNSERIVYQGENPATRSNELQTMNVDGSDQRFLMETATHELHPEFSPDGSQVIYQRRLQGTNDGEIWRVRADGTGAQAVTALGKFNEEPTWGEPGRTIPPSETDPVTPTDPPTQPPAPRADVAIDKSDSADPVVAGENLTYTLRVDNRGATTAEQVVVTDELPGGTTFFAATYNGTYENTTRTVTWELGQVAAGESRTVDVIVTVDPEQFDQLSNTARVTTSTAETDTTNNSDTEVTNLAGRADLSITKTDSKEAVEQGEEWTYTLTARNEGPSLARDVSVVDALPTELQFVSASNNGAFADGEVTWAAGSLQPGATTEFTVTVKAPKSLCVDAIENVATIEASTDDPQMENNTARDVNTVSPCADISIDKSDSVDSVVAGTNLTYDLVVSNAGPGAADAVVVSDELPEGVTFVSATEAGSYDETTRTVTWTLGALADQSSKTLQVTVTVDAAQLDEIANTATITTTTVESDERNNSDREVTPVTSSADLSISKTDSRSTVNRNEQWRYTLTISNPRGQSLARDVTVTDQLPSQLRFVSASDGGALSGGTVTWSLGFLPPNEERKVTVTVQAPPTVYPGAFLNTASVTASTHDPEMKNNSAMDDDTQMCDIKGTDEADTLKGTSANEVICGLGGNDTITGGAGDDVLLGHAGNDILDGEGGSDVVQGHEGSDRFRKTVGIGGDRFYADPSSGDDGSRDVIDYSGYGSPNTSSPYPGVVIHLGMSTAETTAGMDRVFGIEEAIGTFRDDSITGSDAGEILRGGNGDDRILAGGGDDHIWGDGGDDHIYGGSGDDYMSGGEADDMLNGDVGNDTFNGGAGVDEASFLGWGYRVEANLVTGVATGQGDDTLVLIENLHGGAAHDELRGNSGTNVIAGGDGSDNIWLGLGNDDASGGDGIDNIYGEGGRDVLVGGTSIDTLNGGADKDDCWDSNVRVPGTEDTKIACENR